MKLNLERVRKNVAEAATEDLLDRVTVLRDGMEPAALEIIKAELTRRGVSPDDVQIHWESKRANVLPGSGVAPQCSFCDRPAVSTGWDWHRLWGKVPIFPRTFRYCEVHNPAKPQAAT